MVELFKERLCVFVCGRHHWPGMHSIVYMGIPAQNMHFPFICGNLFAAKFN